MRREKVRHTGTEVLEFKIGQLIVKFGIIFLAKRYSNSYECHPPTHKKYFWLKVVAT